VTSINFELLDPARHPWKLLQRPAISHLSQPAPCHSVSSAAKLSPVNDGCPTIDRARVESATPHTSMLRRVAFDHGCWLDQYHRVDDLGPNPVEQHP